MFYVYTIFKKNFLKNECIALFLCFGEPCERFTHNRSFPPSDVSESLRLLTKNQGWAPHSFPFHMFRSFPFFKRNVPFFFVLFSSFWPLMRPKRMFRSFLKKGEERIECNVLLQRTEKNAKKATSFCKERKRTRERFVLLQYIYRYIYRYI